MSLKKLRICCSCIMLIWVIVALSLQRQLVRCQDLGDYEGIDNPTLRPFVTQLAYNKLSNLTAVISRDVIGKRSKFCVKNPEADWNQAFNFSSNTDFLAACIMKTEGQLSRHLCTVAELKFYFNSFFESSNNDNYLKPNINCNLSSWVSGCEPGWTCRISGAQPVELQNSRDIPSRTFNCQKCCEGFFCPHGLTCMIPCPLGSYCPLAKINLTTGLCEPYNYQLPPGQPNHTCGGANLWADVGSSSEIFCPAGSYCSSTVQKNECSSGYYCRMGSTSEKRCFRLTSCNANSSNQNIHAYGLMLIAATSTLLLIIYNCSDQVITTRERRLAKSREAAARSAREKAKAQQRWKAAKNYAKKHASGFQAPFSKRFSFKKSAPPPEQLRILDQDKSDADEDLYPPIESNSLSTSISSSVGPNGKKKEPSDQELNTDSQIFRYAYSQLEKEKAIQKENKNLTFSGVISMATNTELKKRPLIEIAFKDLTLTLKTKNKHLLRCITGKLRPGRITAVMGPSGAGKTSFLSALAGKAISCKMTGLVLINGKNESIHSYKKIIGFVPQDDIVHGNLTVEENLWFSAHCRLSSELTKADKVLIVERVVESLGLQTVRNSLVGTVEKRGISGGQRKRVNVGLEMVMEPSLLILDEPTSGLDSASSQLLLRALRREALEGVNICMVVHQPSYTLFKMFDDLVLLAKGGFVVYHGSVKKVEEYFSSLGINVPERVNPPDHFIDILEGMVMPKASAGVNYRELPVRWMIHNGYPVPLDMQHSAAALGIATAHGTSSEGNEMEDRSFAVELWQDMKSNVELQRDKIRHNFLKSRDLSHRRTPGVFQQYRYYLGRISKQRLREAKTQATDYLILLLAGACLGSLAKVDDQSFGAAGYTYAIIAVSLLCKIAALRSFSLEKLQYWRESASGMSSLAYFLAKDTVDHFNTVVKPVVYLSMFYFFTNPRSSFADNYTVLLCLVYCVTGIAYVLAIFFEPGSAQLWSVLLPVVLTLIATRPKDNKAVKYIAYFGYSGWALEAFVIANAERYYGVWLITRCGSLWKFGYNLHHWGLCIFVLILIGVISRVIAFIGMHTLKRK